MLLAVEGGGFFSSSASGYSKGLTLLLLGRRSEERPMRVLPWNHYQSVEQKRDHNLQLASRKTRVPCGCTSFVCFTCASAGEDRPPPFKVGIVNQSVTLPDTCIPDRSEDCTISESAESEKKVHLKSNLKKPFSRCSSIAGEGDHAHISTREAQRNVGFTERRKVQWTDSCGKELVEIREFEPSDYGSSDDEYGHGRNPRCECVIQ